MKDHALSVMSLEEYEPNPEFVGRNFNAGEVIQLVLKARSGHYLPFNYVQMVMMHELAHCKQMNHSKAFWAVRNQYADQMRLLWARGYTGEGLWGRGARLATGEWERNAVQPGEELPEHLCGGTYRSRGRKRKAKKPVLTYQERKERRILKKFGKNGVALGKEVEEGKSITGNVKPRVAKSKRGRELRAAAALARFDQQKEVQKKEEEEEVRVKDENDVETASEAETDSGDEEYAETEGADAVDIDGKKLLDGKGRGMVKVCEDYGQDEEDSKKELFELLGLSSSTRKAAGSSKSETTKNPTTPAQVNSSTTKAISSKTTIKDPAKQTKIKSERRDDDDKTTPWQNLPTRDQSKQQQQQPSVVSRPGLSANTTSNTPALNLEQLAGVSQQRRNCPVCSFENDALSATCIMCSNVLDLKRVVGAWACESQACSGSSYRNAGDCGVCGVCGQRRQSSKSK